MSRLLPACALLMIIAGLCFAPTALADDWITLFDGKNLSQWEAIDSKLDDWKIVDGNLHCATKDGWISTKEQFANFELELEFKVPEGGNSGVFLRAPRKGNGAWMGLEVQILDNDAKEHQNLLPYQYCGGIYGCVGPSAKVAKKVGEWQSYKIVANGRNVQITLNGTKIIDANLDDYLGELEKHPGIKRERGYIGLQAHGGGVDFRNVRVKRLASK